MSIAKDSIFRSRAMIIAAAAVVALRLLALLAGDARMWGVDMLRYLDSWWVIAFSVLPLLGALPMVGTQLSRMIAKRDFPWTGVFWTLVAVLFAAAVLFPMVTFYYGDGGPLVSEIYKIGAQEHYSSELLLNLQSAPLAGGLLHLFAVLIPEVMYSLGITLPETPLFPFFVLSLLGVVLLGLTMRIEKEHRLHLPLLFLVVGTGGGIFFFSYAEMYLPAFLAVTAYLLAASAALRGDRSVWLAVILYIAAVATHYMMLSLLPSLLYLLLRKQAVVKVLTSSGRALALSFAGVLALAFAAYFAFGFQQSESRVIMPLLPVTTAAGTLSYTLFSSYHLLDLVNLLLLLAAFPLFYLLFASSGIDSAPGAGKSKGENSTARGTARSMSDVPGSTHRDHEALRFQLIAGYSFLLFLFFANTSLGLARDWDIAAPLGVIIVMVLFEFSGKTAGSSTRPQPMKSQLQTARLLQAGIVTILFAVPWIATNVNYGASTARFAGIMKLDDEHMYGDYALSGYEALRKQAVHAKDFARESEILQRMIEIVGYTEQYRMLIADALYYVEKQPERYFQLNDWMLDRLARQAVSLHTRGATRDYAISLKQIDSLAAVMTVESITYSRMQGMYPRILAFADRSGCETGKNILLGTGRYLEENFGEALPFFTKVREEEFRDPRVDGMYGSILYISGDMVRSDAEFEDGLQRYGKDPQYLFMVATSYLRRQERIPEARVLLERARALNPPAQAREQIEDILKQMK
ncbi:MAG: hypothetical protein WC824_03370 [Bacteroidota bacterium]|jgi:hypothetical protein